MEIVNKDLPTGKRFFKVSETLHDQFATFFSRRTHDLTKELSETLKGIGHNSECMRLHVYTYLNWERTTNDDFPIFKLRVSGLLVLSSIHNVVIKHAKKNLSGPLRSGHLDLPANQSELYLQWCPERKGIIYHNCPYEGPLVNNSPGKVSKALNGVIMDAVDEVLMFEMLGEDLEIPYDLRWKNSAQKINELEEILPKFMLGEHSVKDAKKIAYYTDICEAMYVKGGSYVLEKVEDPKVKIPTTLRTRMVYMYGGYKLPDNYQDWFDG